MKKMMGLLALVALFASCEVDNRRVEKRDAAQDQPATPTDQRANGYSQPPAPQDVRTNGATTTTPAPNTETLRR